MARPGAKACWRHQAGHPWSSQRRTPVGLSGHGIGRRTMMLYAVQLASTCKRATWTSMRRSSTSRGSPLRASTVLAGKLDNVGAFRQQGREHVEPAFQLGDLGLQVGDFLFVAACQL